MLDQLRKFITHLLIQHICCPPPRGIQKGPNHGVWKNLCHNHEWELSLGFYVHSLSFSGGAGVGGLGGFLGKSSDIETLPCMFEWPHGLSFCPNGT